MRTGKLKGKTTVVVPYFDTDGERQYTLIKLEGTLYASKVYAGIREFVKDNFGIDVDKDWLYNVPMVYNEFDPGLHKTSEEVDDAIERLIDSLELKDDQTESDTSSIGTEQDAVETEEQVRSL